MSYSGCLRVAELLPNLMNSASSVDAVPAGVFPGSAAYVRWLSSGCALIENALISAGYSVPVPAAAKLYDFVADLEAQYVAYRAEQSRGSTRSGTGDRTRGDGFKAAFDDGLKYLRENDLSRDGLSVATKMDVGGISLSDKQTFDSDTDRVKPRFGKGAFDGNFQNTAAS